MSHPVSRRRRGTNQTRISILFAIRGWTGCARTRGAIIIIDINRQRGG